MAEIEIREFQREDFSLVRDLYFTTKNRFRSENYDRWSFFDTPWGNSIGVIAIDKSLCVSAFVLRPIMFDIGGDAVLGAQATDLMTHPNYRGRGLFLSLVEESMRIAALRGFDIIYTFPNDNSYPGFTRRLNFDHVGDVFAWNYDIRSIRLPFLLWGSQKSTSIVTGRNDITPDELENLIQVSSDERDVCRIKRDQTWLTWRYSEKIGEICQWYTGRDSAGKIQAALLVGERDISWGEFGKGDLRIHEVFAVSEDALVAVFRELTRYAKSQSKSIVRMLVKDARIELALAKAGFKTANMHHMLVRRLSARLLKGNIHQFVAWRIVGGDFVGF